MNKTCHEIDYEIAGDSLQYVEVELDPGETVVAEAGMMNFMDGDIEFITKMGDGSEPEQGFLGKLVNAGKRVLTGESMFLTHFTNRGVGKKRVAFASPFPGKILALDMQALGGTIISQKDSFLCASHGTKVGLHLNKKIGVGLFGNEGFILQKITGDDMVFLHAGGHIVERKLQGETLLVDTGCLVAYTPDVQVDIQRAGNLKSMVFGGEGLFLSRVTGSGSVWIQTLPFTRLARSIVGGAGLSGQGEGSVLGDIVDMVTPD